MNKIKQFFLTWAVLLLSVTPALGAGVVDTSLIYLSEPIVVMFLGMCSLIIVAQLIPALVLFSAIVIAVFKRKKIVKIKLD